MEKGTKMAQMQPHAAHILNHVCCRDRTRSETLMDVISGGHKPQYTDLQS